MAFGNSHKVVFSTISIVVFILILICGISCGATPSVPMQATPPLSTPPQLPASGEWIPDGIVSVGEYNGTKEYGDYELHWAGDEKYAYIAMKARTSGWVSMAVQPGSRMKDADMVFGFVEDGKAAVYDLFSIGDYGPHPPDTELGGTNDILEFGGMEEGGYTIIEFKRALDTGDKYDKPIVSGSNKIIWAYGSGDSLTIKHASRGYGELEF